MNEKEIIIKKRMRSESASFFAVPSVLFGLNFGMLAGMTNAFFSVPFFGNFTLYFGQIFVLICLVVRGVNSALLAVGISSVVTAVSAADPHLIIIFALELLAVHALLQRGMFLFQSVMLYWLFIGVPLLLTLTLVTSNVGSEVLFLNGVTVAVNAIICASVASLFQWFLPVTLLQQQYRHKPPKLASLIFSLCMLTVTLPALMIALFFVNQAASYNESSVLQAMDKSASRVSAEVDGILKEHGQGLVTVASLLAKSYPSNPQLDYYTLQSVYENQLAFASLTIVDDRGILRQAVPAKFTDYLATRNNISIADKDYFKATRRTLEPQISEALIGLHEDRDKLISLTAPIVVDGDFRGMIQGAITLETLDRINDEIVGNSFDYVIYDTKKRILASSLIREESLLSNFDFSKAQHQLIDDIELIELIGQKYLFKSETTNNGWTIAILGPPALVIEPLVFNFYILILSAIFVLLAFATIASQLAKKVTKPLEDIAEHFPDATIHPQIIEEARVSEEIVKLTHRLISSHAVMNDFQQQLKEQVDNKTRQLKQLNKELYSLAQKDPLTQLLNRAGFNRFALTSYRNCVRNNITMSMILIDIDHFKKINDNYGHPFGDKCITTVAKVLQKYCKRDTDILGRYGGEEFIVMIVGGDLNEHHTRVKLVADAIRNIKFKPSDEIMNMTVSAGICSIKEDFSLEFDAMIKLADEQLYLSKRTGRDKTSIIVR